MVSEKAVTRVAIVGFGPRGLGALEALAVETNGPVAVDIFEPLQPLGAGPNYDPAQSPLCILNIPLRTLQIDPPQFLADQIGSLARWSPTPFLPDDFPPRADVGAYLTARFHAVLASVPKMAVAHHDVHVTGLGRDDAGWWLTAEGARHGPFAEVLLTQGQPETAPDPQLETWKAHAKTHDLTLLHAYPANELLSKATEWAGQTVAIRGLGLSTFDVLRMLTIGVGGRFEDGVYKPSGAEPRQILPFSLTGRAPEPKPANADIDRKFDVTNHEAEAFEAVVASALDAGSGDVLPMICAALVGPSVRILAAHGSGDGDADVADWLNGECDKAGARDVLEGLDALKMGIEMAHGRACPSIGYVVGQIWRKWVPIVRDQFDLGGFGVETAKAVVGFEEGLKRISSGPPVSACEQLLALIGCGVVSLCAADDPDIRLRPDGWLLVEGADAQPARVVIDAVIASPNVARVIDPLVVGAMEAGIVQPLTEGFGLRAMPDGQLVSQSGHVQTGLSALGRLVFGSAIAVDSLHDCFGPATQRWAAGVVVRQAADFRM